MLTAEWLHRVLYFTTEYRNSGQNIIILFCKYLVDIWECVAKSFWEYINRKHIAVGLLVEVEDKTVVLNI
jgi:hypothetical protein